MRGRRMSQLKVLVNVYLYYNNFKFCQNKIQRHQKYWKKISLVTKNFDMQKSAMKLEWYVSQKGIQIRKSHGQLPLDSKSAIRNSDEWILVPFVLLWLNFRKLTCDLRYSEDDNDKKSKYSVCVQRQNHEKFGHMTVAYLGSRIIHSIWTIYTNLQPMKLDRFNWLKSAT